MRDFDTFFNALKEYYEEYGNVNVPSEYRKEGYRLGLKVQWIRMGQMILTPEQKEKVNQLGFAWRIRNQKISFDELIVLLKEFEAKYGHCNVWAGYVTNEGVKLGEVMANIRAGARKTSDEEKELLINMGFLWKNEQQDRRITCMPFERIYHALEKFYQENGHLEVPEYYKTPEGLKLGYYVQKIRGGTYKVLEDERKMLDNLHFRWKYTPKKRYSFDEVCESLKEYYEQNGNYHVPIDYVTVTGLKLGNVLSRIRTGARKTTEKEKDKLEKLGFVF